MSGRHRTRSHFTVGPFRVPVALVVVVGLVAATAITLRVVAVSASGCSGGIELRVAATPEIAPVLSDVGAAWSATKPQVAGECVNLTIEAVASAKVASALTVNAGGAIDVAIAPEPTPRDDEIPMVWVPDSSVWLTRVGAVDKAAFLPNARSVASSPVVLAMSGSAATAVGWPARRLQLPALRTLLTEKTLRLGIAEPRRETASLIATMLLGESLVSTDDDLPALVQTFRSVARTSSTAELLRSFGEDVSAGPASEQAVLAYNGTRPAQPLTAVQIGPAAPQLDYPYAIHAGVSLETTQAAEQFRAALLAPAGAAALAAKCFRLPSGRTAAEFPASAATITAAYDGVSLSEPQHVQRALELWSAAITPSRTLILFDTTSSMAGPLQAGGGVTRAQVMIAAAGGGMGLFAADSKVGMWTFAATYREVLSVDDLTAQRRTEFTQRLSATRPATSNRLELYSTLLAAYKGMKDEYDPSRSNIIVVVTDGGDSNTTALRREQFNQSLQLLADPTKPIRVVLIGISVNPAETTNLMAVADMVGGGYFPLTSPEQIQTIFLRALLRVGRA